MTQTQIAGTVAPLGTERRSLAEALRNGNVPIAVYGLGKVGLPMAARFADLTANVTGVDIDPDVVSAVNDGTVPFDHEPGLDSLVSETVGGGELVATTDGRAAAAAARLHVVIVPVTLRMPARDAGAPRWTPGARASDEGYEGDLRSLVSVVGDVSAGLTAGDLVLIESTVPPGTTDSVVLPRLERGSGLERGTFGTAVSPERVASGRVLEDLRGAYPKIVGGVDRSSTQAAQRVYQALTSAEVIPVSDARTAEAVKLFEGVYRDVNIALANELGKATDDLDIDVREAIAAANTQPYCDIHDPGAGVGGHCIPIYPHLLLGALDFDASLIRTARAVNDSMPAFVVRKVVDELAADGIDVDRATVAILGLTYREDIPETRNSPAGPIIEGLLDRGAVVFGVDPVLDGSTQFGVHLVSLEQMAQIDPDAAVIVTGHESFLTHDWHTYDGLVLIDTRDVLADQDHHPTYTVGRGHR